MTDDQKRSARGILANLRMIASPRNSVDPVEALRILRNARVGSPYKEGESIFGVNVERDVEKDIAPIIMKIIKSGNVMGTYNSASNTITLNLIDDHPRTYDLDTLMSNLAHEMQHYDDAVKPDSKDPVRYSSNRENPHFQIDYKSSKEHGTDAYAAQPHELRAQLREVIQMLRDKEHFTSDEELADYLESALEIAAAPEGMPHPFERVLENTTNIVPQLTHKNGRPYSKKLVDKVMRNKKKYVLKNAYTMLKEEIDNLRSGKGDWGSQHGLRGISSDERTKNIIEAVRG